MHVVSYTSWFIGLEYKSFSWICACFLFLPIEPYPGCWTQTNDVHGFGGISHIFTSLADCKTACVNDPGCVAIDWEPTNTQQSCWILMSDTVDDTTEPGVITHHALNRHCLS